MLTCFFQLFLIFIASTIPELLTSSPEVPLTIDQRIQVEWQL